MFRNFLQAASVLNPFRAITLVLLLAFSCKTRQPVPAGAPSPPPDPPNCASLLNDQLCCEAGKTVKLKLIRSRAELEAVPGYESVKAVIGTVDFRGHDLILLFPSALPLSHKLSGPPTSTGLEWQIYCKLPAWCLNDSAALLLDCAPTEGSASGFYWRKIPKSRAETLSCGCGIPPLPVDSATRDSL